MIVKKTGMAKSDAKKLMGKMDAPGIPAFEKTGMPVVDRREQRKLDQAQGLVPFAIKLNSGLVEELKALAKTGDVDLNEVVAALLKKGMAA